MAVRLALPCPDGFVGGRAPELSGGVEKFGAHLFDGGIGEFFEFAVEGVVAFLEGIVVFGVVAAEERPAGMG